MRTSFLTTFGAAVLAAMLIQQPAFAFDPVEAPAAVLHQAKSLDCGQNPDACHYIATVEAAAWVDACTTMFRRMGGSPAVAESFERSLGTWSAVTPTIRTAVLSPSNLLRQNLAQKDLEFLVGMSTMDDPLGVECSRLGMVQDNLAPEDFSLILDGTRNAQAWQAKRRATLAQTAAR